MCKYYYYFILGYQLNIVFIIRFMFTKRNEIFSSSFDYTVLNILVLHNQENYNKN